MAEHIKVLIEEYIKKNKTKQNQFENINKTLEIFFSKDICKQINIRIKDNKKLKISFNSSSLLYQFHLQEKEILETIKKKNPQIKEIRVE